jgi:23S rRNA (pseudouridine1915-N3)-methyltransferase
MIRYSLSDIHHSNRNLVAAFTALRIFHESRPFYAEGGLLFRFGIYVVGRTRAPFLLEGEAFYLNRLGQYARVQWVEVKPAPATKGLTDAQIMAGEGLSLLARLPDKDCALALDRRGKTYDSEGLANRIQTLASHHGRIAFVIGGHAGLSDDVLSRVNESISLSQLTFTHEMSRLVLLEQIYRAMTILRGEKYHK